MNTPRDGAIDTGLAFDVILAAGAGRRLGGNKGLFPLEGVPIVTRLLAEVRGSLLDGAIVVAGAEARELLPLILEGGGIPVVNTNWEAGQTSSLRVGLLALPETCVAFLVHPVDHAFTRRSDLDALVCAFRNHPEREHVIVRPTHGGSFGHPVLYAARYRDEFLALAPEEPGHAVYRRHRHRVVLVPVTNPLIARDVDTPADLPPTPP